MTQYRTKDPRNAVLWLSVFVLALWLGITAAAVGQSADDAFQSQRILELRQRQVELQTAREGLERVEELFEQGLVSEAEVDQARAGSAKAQLDTQQALLRLMDATPRVAVRRAVKRRDARGRITVNLQLVNETTPIQPGSSPGLGLEGLPPLPATILDGSLRDVVVSLRDSGAESPGNPNPLRGAVIAMPYERSISELETGQTADLEFRLLRDVSTLMVHLNIAGEPQELDVHLQHARGEHSVHLTSTQPSQEADLGSEAVFDLRLNRSSVDRQSYRLGVADLPQQVEHRFLDPSTGARLSEVTLPSGVTQRRLELRVRLPDRTTDGLALDEPLRFRVLAGGSEASENSTRRPEGRADNAVAETFLSIIPQGVGRLEISAPSLFSELAAGESLDTTLVVRNPGSRRVDNVRVLAQAQAAWDVELEPQVIPSLAPGEEKNVQLLVELPSDVTPGEYEIDVQATSSGFNRPIESSTKNYRVHVEPAGNLWMTALLVAVALLLVGGTVFTSIKLTRR